MKGKKTGGRRRGTPNRTTAEIREALRAFVDMNIDSLQDDFDTLDPEKRLTFFERIVRMVVPPPVNPDALTTEQMEFIISYLEDKQRETRP
jgi:hypothetical protein